MAIEKKNFPEIKLYTGAKGGNYNLDRNWFLYYKAENGKRKKFYGPINSFSTIEERQKAAEELRWKLLSQIESRVEMKKELTKHLQRRFFNRKKTRQGYESKVRMLLAFHRGKHLTKKSLSNFFLHLRNERHASTYNGYLVTLGKLFDELGWQHLLQGIERVKAFPTPARYFQPHQIKILKKHILEKHPDLWLFVQFVYYCFIRPTSELRPLKIGDILFEERKILVKGSISKNERNQYVCIPDAFWPQVKPLMQRRPGDYIFPSPIQEGKSVSHNRYSRRHRIILKSLGFDTDVYKLYSWKHTGAVACVKAGISVKELQIQLRHHSLDQVDAYLRQLGVHDIRNLRKEFRAI